MTPARAPQASLPSTEYNMVWAEGVGYPFLVYLGMKSRDWL
jgi:hypothetical protein